MDDFGILVAELAEVQVSTHQLCRCLETELRTVTFLAWITLGKHTTCALPHTTHLTLGGFPLYTGATTGRMISKFA